MQPILLVSCTSARVSATSSLRRLAPAKPINNTAMSLRAATPAGHAAAVCSMELIRVRMSSNNNGDRLACGVERMRRIQDNARRTTSDRPGASRPAAVWNWLMLDTHRVNDAGAYRHRPGPVISAAASVT